MHVHVMYIHVRAEKLQAAIGHLPHMHFLLLVLLDYDIIKQCVSTLTLHAFQMCCAIKKKIT